MTIYSNLLKMTLISWPKLHSGQSLSVIIMPEIDSETIYRYNTTLYYLKFQHYGARQELFKILESQDLHWDFIITSIFLYIFFL